MNNFRNYFFIISIFVSFGLWSSEISNFNPTNSIDWQKIQLKDKITRQIEEAIKTIDPDKKAVVNVNIELNEVPTFISPQAPSSDQGPAAKNKKKKVKLTDVKMEQSPPEDVVVFAKMGLAAPIFGDDDIQTAPSPMLPASIDSATAYARLVEHFDFFKYLRAVTIDIYLEKSLSKEQSDTTISLIKSLSLDVGKIKPVINFKSIAISKPQPELIQKDTIETLAKFSNVIALVLAVLVAGGLALFLFKRLSQLIREQIETLSAALGSKPSHSKDETSKSGETQKTSSEVSSSTTKGPQTDDQVSGLQKFELLIQTNTSNATLLLKRWISAKTPIAQKALVALAGYLKNEDMLKLFAQLSIDDRKIWKKALNQELTVDEQHIASNFIAKQIAEDLILPPLVSDADLADILASLSLQEYCDICTNNIKLGAILFNVLDSGLISSILEQLDEAVASQVMEASLCLSDDHIRTSLPELKKYVLQYRKSSNRSHFSEKMLDLIKTAPAEKERLLYTAYSQMVDEAQIITVALENLPFELFTNLPQDIYKASLKSMTSEERSHFIFSLEDPKKDEIKNIWASPGTKARDLLEFDLEKFETNKLLAQKVIESRAIIWKNFVNNTRKIIRNDHEIMEKLKPLVLEWTQTLTKAANNVRQLSA